MMDGRDRLRESGRIECFTRRLVAVIPVFPVVECRCRSACVALKHCVAFAHQQVAQRLRGFRGSFLVALGTSWLPEALSAKSAFIRIIVVQPVGAHWVKCSDPFHGPSSSERRNHEPEGSWRRRNLCSPRPERPWGKQGEMIWPRLPPISSALARTAQP